MTDTINILCATDANYIPYCGVMLTSLFENNKDEKIVVYVMTQDPTSPSFESYRKLADKYNQTIILIGVSQDVLEKNNAKVAGHISIATYFRLFAANLLPADIDKILYLDGDLIVNGKLRDLYTKDITNYAISGAIDCLYFDEDIYSRLDYDKDLSYFNAGVVLINLKWWREHAVHEAFMSYLAEKYAALRYFDQDVLNKVLLGNVDYFPITYNFQYYYVVKSHWQHYSKELQSQIRDVAANPVVIHYCGPLKPWHYRYVGRMKNDLWWKYEKLSMWEIHKIYKPYMKSFKWYVKRVLYTFRIRSKCKTINVPEEFENL